MSVINLLSSKIYNRIAAGEVVERPASVIKELVENSLDSGAKNITIEIISGGISLIKVTDDGCGIEKSELKKALLPHATSKISSLKDLDNICSLGFRGEALASIASVSKITIVSKPQNQMVGASIYAEGGEIGDIIDSSSIDGTEITVKNLFFNTPAREKFLKSERLEESEITNVVSKFILGNTSVAFKYISDGKLIFQSYGDGFESAMSCIYGPNIIDECYFIETVKNGISINGYIGKQHFTKGNRTYQTVFLNGRYIQNQTISSAIANAYSSYLMKRQYPFYVLSILVPTEIVDVNVHPNKLDVRFSNNQIIYGSLYSIISKVLDGSSEAISIVLNKNEKNLENTSDINIDYVKHNTSRLNILIDKPISKPILGTVEFNTPIPSSIKFEESQDFVSTQNNSDIFAENKAYLEKLERDKILKINKVEQQSACLEREMSYVGQVLNTYLIFDDGQDVYLVDQHAAHERILFDKLNNSLKNADIIKQPLLIPFILSVNSTEFEFLISKISLFTNLGLDICEFGNNSFKVSAIPSFLTDINIQKFFDEILSDLNTLKLITINDLLMEKIAQKACKSAVKSGDKLSEFEIKLLIEKLKENIGLKCPHGRPVAIKITRMEIDKWFKRIV